MTTKTADIFQDPLPKSAVYFRRFLAYCLMDYGLDYNADLLNALSIVVKEHIVRTPLSVCTERKPENITEDEFIKMHLLGAKDDIITSLGFTEVSNAKR